MQAAATVQIVLDAVQAKYPGNEKVKQCGPKNHDGFCFDPSRPHRNYHVYLHRENCESWEGVPCDGTLVPNRWVPVNKPVVVESER